MAVHPCPVCGLRFTNGSELVQHAADDHTRHLRLEDETQETVTVPRRPAERRDTRGVLRLPW